MTPLKLARKVAGKYKVENLFARDPLTVIVDSRLEDKPHRILCLMRALTFEAPAAIPYPYLAIGGNCQKRHAIRIVDRLERDGWITIDRSGKDNVYTVVDQPDGKPQTNRSIGQCVSCKIDKPWRSKAGVCMACLKQGAQDRRVDELVQQNPGIDYHVARTIVKGDQDKRFRRAFERAKGRVGT